MKSPSPLFALVDSPLGCSHNTVAVAAEPSNPSSVLILVDAPGDGDTGCYGAAKVKTPNIYRLASEGRRFMDALHYDLKTDFAQSRNVFRDHPEQGRCWR